MEERLNEILERLAALEERMDRLERERDGAATACGFLAEERRIVDLIVGLTTESVVGAMEARMEHPAKAPRHDHHPRHHHRGPGCHGPWGGPPGRRGPPIGGPPGSWGGPPPPPPGWPHGDR